MESERRRRRGGGVVTRRKPLSDCTNTTSSSPSSSSSIALKPSSFSAFHKPATTILDNASNPSSPLPTPSSSKTWTVDLEASKPISVVYSRRRTSNKRKEKEKAVALPVGGTPILNITDDWGKSDGVEGVNRPKAKAKALTVPCQKKQRAVSSEQDLFKDPLLQDYIEKQNAYFKMIDEFKLPEEEVESVDELD